LMTRGHCHDLTIQQFLFGSILTHRSIRSP
jgi:hypothetical protein